MKLNDNAILALQGAGLKETNTDTSIVDIDYFLQYKHDLYFYQYYDRRENGVVWAVARYSTGEVLTRQIEKDDFDAVYSDIFTWAGRYIIKHKGMQLCESEEPLFKLCWTCDDPANEWCWARNPEHIDDVALDIRTIEKRLKNGDELRIKLTKFYQWLPNK